MFEQLPTITVDGLPDAEARKLLSSVAGGALNAQAVDRILADTRNNPLALVELGTQYTADQLSGRAVQPEPLPLGQRLQEHFLRQVRSLRQTPRRSRCWPRPTREVSGVSCGARRHRPASTRMRPQPKRLRPACWSFPAARCGSATRCCGPPSITARALLIAGTHTVR